MANWWDSFDREGWSYCRSYEYVTGFLEVTGLVLTQLSSWKKRGVVRLLLDMRTRHQLANIPTG